jgi:hypothetical protein
MLTFSLGDLPFLPLDVLTLLTLPIVPQMFCIFVSENFSLQHTSAPAVVSWYVANQVAESALFFFLFWDSFLFLILKCL